MMHPGDEVLEALSENHKRSISVSLHLLDKGLCEWEQWTAGHIPAGLMYHQQDNISVEQKAELQRRTARAREIIRRVRDALSLEPARPGSAELIVGQATVLWEMLTELNSASLRGYGEVSPELTRYLDPIGAELTEEMNKISGLFSRPANASEARFGEPESANGAFSY